MKNLKVMQPTKRERTQLTRIYGAEENWLGVATNASVKRRAEKAKAKRNAA